MTTVVVSGIPAAQGSKRLVRLKNGRTVMLENSKRVKPWRDRVASAARAVILRPLEGDVQVTATVLFPRPKAHFRKDRGLRPNLPPRPGRADVDKLARAILDALTGVAYADDRQVAALAIQRCWSDSIPAKPGDGEGTAIICIEPVPRQGIWTYQPAPRDFK